MASVTLARLSCIHSVKSVWSLVMSPPTPFTHFTQSFQKDCSLCSESSLLLIFLSPHQEFSEDVSISSSESPLQDWLRFFSSSCFICVEDPSFVTILPFSGSLSAIMRQTSIKCTASCWCSKFTKSHEPIFLELVSIKYSYEYVKMS